jgi:hypothetical protein
MLKLTIDFPTRWVSINNKHEKAWNGEPRRAEEDEDDVEKNPSQIQFHTFNYLIFHFPQSTSSWGEGEGRWGGGSRESLAPAPFVGFNIVERKQLWHIRTNKLCFIYTPRLWKISRLWRRRGRKTRDNTEREKKANGERVNVNCFIRGNFRFNELDVFV